MIRPARRSSVVPSVALAGCLGLFLVWSGLLAPSRASAQAPIASGAGMDLHLFRPAVDSKGMFTVNGTDILGENAFSFGLIIDGGFGIFPFNGFTNDPNTQAANAGRPRGAYGQGRLVDVFGTGILHFNYGIANIAVVGIQVPVQALAGQNVTIPGQYNLRNPDSMGVPRGLGLSYQGIGNLGLHAKCRFLRAERDPIGLAAILQFEFGTGASSSFAGEPGVVSLWPMVAVEYRPIREIRIAANAGTRLNFSNQATLNVGGTTNPSATNALAPTLTGGTNLQYGSLLTFGLGASFRLADAFELTVEGYGAQILSQVGVRGALSVEAVGGMKVFVERNSYLMFGGGAGIPTGGWSTADLRAFLGFVFEPSIGDRDGDGIRDDADACSDQPEDLGSAGWVPVPDGPGLGVTYDWAFIKRQRTALIVFE